MVFQLTMGKKKGLDVGAERSEAPTSAAGTDVEVPAKAVRRKFTAEYKRQIVEEAELSREEPGGIGELLRREGLYSSQLAKWRQLYKEGALKGLRDDKRGRKKTKNPLEGRVLELERENQRLEKKLKQAKIIIDVQKKVAAIMADQSPESDGDDL